MRKQGHSHLGSAAFVLLFSIVFWHWTMPPGSGATLEPGIRADLVNYFLPMLDLTRNSFRECRVPLWNPYQACGTPLAATMQAGVFYPSKILLVFLPTHLFMRVDAFLHLVAGGIFMILFLRNLGCTFLGQCVGAALFSFAVFSAGLSCVPAIEASVWLPAIALSVDHLCASGKTRHAIMLALLLSAQCLTGFVQYFIYTVYFVAAYFVFRIVQKLLFTRPDRTLVARCCILFAFSVAVAAGVTAVQTVPSWEFLTNSIRSAGLSPDQVQYTDLIFAEGSSPGAFMTKLVDTTAEGLPFASGGSGHITIVGLLLTCFLPLAGHRKSSALFFAIVGVSTLIMAFGTDMAHNLLFTLYRKLPLSDILRAPSRLRYIGLFCVTVVASLGAEGLRCWLNQPQCRGSAAVAFTMQAVVVATLIVFSTWAGRIFAGIYVAAVIVASGFRRDSSLSARVREMSVVSICLGLIVANILVSTPRDGIFRQLTPDYYSREIETLTTVQHQAGYQRVVQLGIAKHKLSQIIGSYSPGEYEAAWLKEYESLCSAHHVRSFFGLSVFSFQPMRLLDLMSVNYIIARRPMGDRYKSSQLVPVIIEDDLYVYKNHGALPRAYVAYDWRYMNAHDIPAATAGGEFDPRRTVLLEAGSDPRHTESPSLGITSGEILSYVPEAVEFRVEALRPGIAVLTDTWYPGWRAFVGDVPACIERVNGMFRGVFVPRGTHTVRLEYRPMSFLWGLGLSMACLSWLLLLALFTLWRRPRRGKMPRKIVRDEETAKTRQN